MRALVRLPIAAAVALHSITFLCTGSYSARAQGSTPQPSVSAAEIERWLDEAGRLFASRTSDEAQSLYERALDAARQLRLEAQESRALCGLGEVWSFKTRYLEARTFAEQCLAIRERLSLPAEIGSASLLLSRISDRAGDGAAALTNAERALAAFEAAGEPRGRARATLQVLSLRRPAASRPLYERAVADARSVGDRYLEGQVLHAWGDLLFGAAEYEESLEKLNAAAVVFQPIDARTELGTVFNSIGRVYRAHGRLDEALRLQSKALELHRALPESFEHMQSLNAVAAIQLALGQIDESRANYERALRLAERSSSPLIQDFLRANIAGLQLEQGEFAAAASTLEQVIARGFDRFPTLRYTRLAFAYLNLGRHKEALQAAARAVDLCESAVDACIDALGYRASAHRALGDYSSALADLHQALQRIEDTRGKLVPADFLKQNFHRRAEEIYSKAIALQMREQKDREALEIAELARARALLDLLASRAVRLEGVTRGFPDALPPRGGGPGALGLPSALTAVPATSGELIDVAARLRSTLVLYWVAEDALYVWVINADGRLTTRRVEVLRAKLGQLIDATMPQFEAPVEEAPRAGRQAITTRGEARIAFGKDDRKAWRALHDLLIRPIRDVLPARGELVTIVPHGALSSLSFAALQDGRGRYLVEDYTIHYVPAGAVLQFTAARRRADARTGEVLLVADPVIPPRSPLEPRLPRLPGSRREISAITQVVSRTRATRLEGADATESRIRTALAGKAVVHLATHAVAREDDPMASYLAFSRDGDGAEADGWLTAEDIYRLRLDADLVVLSACRSGGGRVLGDGTSTFARAFLYSGTPSLVASLWDVADEPTNRLLPTFYRSWLGGMSKARSLRAAQLRLLRELRAGAVSVATPIGPVKVPEHPVFWAGFVLVGEPD
jgi:CHAT domain-containing protein/Tfp pilus assembly protein PilF